jgi:hypothetical protein
MLKVSDAADILGMWDSDMMCRRDIMRMSDSNEELIQIRIYCCKLSNSTHINDFSSYFTK